MTKKIVLTRKELTTILEVATGNVKDFVMDSDNFIDEQLEALNYTHSCELLKVKEVMCFEEWQFVNNYKKLFDFFVKDGKSFTESELMQIYKDQIKSL